MTVKIAHAHTNVKTNKFSKVAEYKINTQKTVVFTYINNKQKRS